MRFGVVGGATQPQMHAQIVINMVDFGRNGQVADDAARILHSGPRQPTDEMMRDDEGVYYGASESRKDIHAAGY